MLVISAKGYLYIVLANNVTGAVSVNQSGVVTELNNKMDKDGKNATCSVCTERYINGSSWYRVYSDGWCEQGGTQEVPDSNDPTNVVFLKSYKDTNYFVTIQRYNVNTGQYSAGYIGDMTISNYATNSFTIGRGYNGPVKWIACGYVS